MLINFGNVKLKLSFLLVAILVLLPAFETLAQCSMCKAVLESNLNEGDKTIGGGVNDGIMYIMFLPYLLFVVIGYLMYKHYKKMQQQT